jgi:alkaline phosphatase
MKLLSRIVFTAVMLAAAACKTSATAEPAPTNRDVPHGIVLVVGDGMGAAHFTLARLLRGDRYQIGRLPQVALVATSSASSRATDSAAAATAYATGIKTTNGFLGVDAAGASHPTVIEVAESRGLATGLVSTAKFGDATPAAFASHVRDRRDIAAISTQLVAEGVDVLCSNGLEWFGRDGLPTLQELASIGGYQPVRSAAELRSAHAGPVLAAFPSGQLDGDSPDMPLSTIAEWAIGRLAADPDGFFLLLEQEGTDTASHQNNLQALKSSLIALDETVGIVMDLLRERGDILVIVTGDHETGGLQIGGSWDAPEDVWGSRDHTGEAVPMFAAGPGAEALAGFDENTEVGKSLLSLVETMGH